MTLKQKIQEKIAQAFEQYPELFLIDFTISPDNKVVVTIDGDYGVTLQDCINVSRAIEQDLDREEEDFALEVASAGATSALKFIRQYNKNIGRKLKVVTLDQEKYEATLDAVVDNNIVLKWKSREPKPVGKGKVTVEKEIEIPFENIKEAIVIISF
ncbi:ribosome assembly cofactor RimP [Myroides sp. LJL115]